jgi:hypothetical protein
LREAFFWYSSAGSEKLSVEPREANLVFFIRFYTNRSAFRAFVGLITDWLVVWFRRCTCFYFFGLSLFF